MKKAMTAIMLLAMLTGCSKTLSRGKAKDIIWEHNHYDKPVPVEFHLTQDELAESKKRGFWTSDGVTPYGTKFFALGGACHCITTVAKVQPVIEVTGITGDESDKKVEYTIDWFANLPSEVRDLCKDHLNPEPYSVIMRLYDDGWRVVR